MIIKVGSTGSVDEFNTLLDQVTRHPDVQSVLILACDANGFTPALLDERLTKTALPVFGGIFPEIIVGHEKLSRGCVVAGLPTRAAVYPIAKLSDMDVDYEAVIEEKNVPIGSTKTMLVLVDGMSKRIGTLIESLFNMFGLAFNYIGGGAGSLSFVPKPCLFTNQGLLQDSALLVMLDVQSGIGVSHGWREVSGPYHVTKADRNAIITLDWKPAFQVYREVVEKHAQKVFTDDNFFDIAKSFPFGINKFGAEKIVRDPFLVGDDGSLICVGEVPEGAYVHILTGDAASLVSAAQRALQLGENSFAGNPDEETILFIDCISRALFLEETFDQELRAVHRKNRPLIGALTLGEIANSGKDYLEFYNKTAVIGVLDA